MANCRIFVYVSHAGGAEGGEIRVLQLDPDNGEVTPVQKFPIVGTPMSIAVSPDFRFLHVALRSQPYLVASFAVDSLNGKLTHLSNAPLPHSMAYISTDRTGRYLLGSSTPTPLEKARPRSSLISVSSIGPNGFVQPAHQIVRTEPKAHAILPDPANRHVLVTCCDGDVILRQVFDSVNGTFSPNPLPPVRTKPNAGPRHLIFHPNHRRVYMLTEPGAWVYVYDYDAGMGALNELQIASAAQAGFDGKPHGADIHLTPDGRFLYVSERASHTLAAFKVDLSSGLLTHIENFPTEKYPRSFAIDPYGRYLLAVGYQSDSMTIYRIDSGSGHLEKRKEYQMGKNPHWIEIVRLP